MQKDKFKSGTSRSRLPRGLMIRERQNDEEEGRTKLYVASVSSRSHEVADLQRRLVLFGASVCRTLRRVKYDPVMRHIGNQLVRSSTSPAANFGEARAAESRRDFIHKMQICLKELRETGVWLEYLCELDPAVDRFAIGKECGELTAIFITSIATARRNQRE